jgi:hypothetical protein
MEPDHQVQNPLNSCPICLEDIIANEVFSQLDSCNHHLCQPCFKQLIGYSDNCPLCGIRFSGCFYIKNKNIIHQHIMTDVDLENVKKNKNSFYHGKIFNIYSITEENFDCFTKEEILIELRHYQKLAENMKVNLFMQRNSDGSQREYKIIHDVMENLEISKKEVNSNVYNSKTVMKNLDLIINGIKDLQQRKYVNILFKIILER